MKDFYLISTVQINFIYNSFLEKEITVKEQIFVVVEIQGRKSNKKPLSS